jgi:hypothetical protein
LVVPATAILVLAGCSSTPAVSPTPPPVAPATGTASPPTAGPTPPPTSPAASEIAAMDLSASAALVGGRYTRAGFEPRITFEVADQEWAAVQLFPGFFDIQQDVGTPDVIAIQFTTTDAVYGADLAVVPVATAADAIAGLKANPTLKVVESTPATIGGQACEALTVDTAGDQEARIMHTPPGALSMDPARRMRLCILDVKNATGGLLAILLGGSVAQWPKAEAAAQPVLASVTIGE